MRPNLHRHILVIDGVYETAVLEGQVPDLHPLAGPSDEEVGIIVEKIARRAVKLLRRQTPP